MHQPNPVSRSAQTTSCFSWLPSRDRIGECLQQAWEAVKTFFSSLFACLCCCRPKSQPAAPSQQLEAPNDRLDFPDRDELLLHPRPPQQSTVQQPPVSIPFWDEISSAMVSPEKIAQEASTKPPTYLNHALNRFQKQWKDILIGFATGKIELIVDFQPKTWTVSLDRPNQVELLGTHLNQSLAACKKLFPQNSIAFTELETSLSHLNHVAQLRELARLMNVQTFVENLERLTNSFVITIPEFQPVFAKAYANLTSSAFSYFPFDIDNQVDINHKQCIDTCFARLAEKIQCVKLPPINFNRSEQDLGFLSQLDKIARSTTVQAFVEDLEALTVSFEIKLPSNQSAFAKAYAGLTSASFVNFTFYLDNPGDVARKQRIEQCFEQLADAIKCEKISIEFDMYTDADNLLAATIQQQNDLARTDGDETLARMIHEEQQ